MCFYLWFQAVPVLVVRRARAIIVLLRTLSSNRARMLGFAKFWKLTCSFLSVFEHVFSSWSMEEPDCSCVILSKLDLADAEDVGEANHRDGSVDRPPRKRALLTD
jgi:hypothetical protein